MKDKWPIKTKVSEEVFIDLESSIWIKIQKFEQSSSRSCLTCGLLEFVFYQNNTSSMPRGVTYNSLLTSIESKRVKNKNVKENKKKIEMLSFLNLERQKGTSLEPSVVDVVDQRGWASEHRRQRRQRRRRRLQRRRERRRRRSVEGWQKVLSKSGAWCRLASPSVGRASGRSRVRFQLPEPSSVSNELILYDRKIISTAATTN